MNVIGVLSCGGFFAVLVVCATFAHRPRARRSGWTQLSRRYPIGRPSAGKHFVHATAHINGRAYDHVLDIRVGRAGMDVRIPGPFRLSHPPMFLPWDDVTRQESGEASDEIRLGIGEHANIVLMGPVADAAARALSLLGGRSMRQ